MAKKLVWDYVVVYNPETEDAGQAQVIARDIVLAATEDKARAKVIREIPSDWEDDLDNIDILIRPFR
jgi:hypothetical protein